jgi:hypothetical protein
LALPSLRHGLMLLLQVLDLLLVTRGFSSFFLLVIFFPEHRWKLPMKSFSLVVVSHAASLVLEPPDQSLEFS